jgi:hypothetical protein
MGPIEHAICVMGFVFGKKYKDKELSNFALRLASYYNTIANEDQNDKTVKKINKEALKIEKKLKLIK